MGVHYLVLGAGRQGTAAAYDLARNSDTERITLVDADAETAQRAAHRVNMLTGTKLAAGQELDVSDHAALGSLLEQAQVALSAVPYYFNLAITRAAISTRTHLCDLGGNTAIVRDQLALNEQARQAGVSIIPDCGMGPGLINTMGAFAIDLLDVPEEIRIYDAGLPQDPQPPWNYQLAFHINGLTNEMDGQAVFLRDGQIVHVNTLTEPEFIDIPPLGRLEADVTSGGTSTAPWTFQDKVRRYENKVLRYLGHYEWLRAFKTLGLFSEQPVEVGEQLVVPRQLYHALLDPHIRADGHRDVGVIRVVGAGLKEGREARLTIDLIDYYDEETGFTSMERLTGWHCSVMMAFQARGQVLPGVIPVEAAVPAAEFMTELAKRGITYSIQWES